MKPHAKVKYLGCILDESFFGEKLFKTPFT